MNRRYIEIGEYYQHFLHRNPCKIHSITEDGYGDSVLGVDTGNDNIRIKIDDLEYATLREDSDFSLELDCLSEKAEASVYLYRKGTTLTMTRGLGCVSYEEDFDIETVADTTLNANTGMWEVTLYRTPHLEIVGCFHSKDEAIDCLWNHREDMVHGKQ